MKTAGDVDNFRVYSSVAVAEHYASLRYLTPCEQLLFSKYLKAGMRILDAGVGGGRTTPYLSKQARRYVGIDYSEAMVDSCRARFPNLEFAVADASDLSIFGANSFDAVIMAFNTVDYIVPEELRRQCFAECCRVLRPGGVLIFSSHNPRCILARPGWSRAKVRAFAERISRSRILIPAIVAAVTVLKAVQASARAVVESSGRIQRITKRAFWTGEGHILDSEHGGLLTHYWIPRKAIAELSRTHFNLAEVVGDDYPRRSGNFLTDWYYYVFIRAESLADREERCA